MEARQEGKFVFKQHVEHGPWIPKGGEKKSKL